MRLNGLNAARIASCQTLLTITVCALASAGCATTSAGGNPGAGSSEQSGEPGGARVSRGPDAERTSGAEPGAPRSSETSNGVPEGVSKLTKDLVMRAQRRAPNTAIEGFDLTDAALIASGFDTPAALKRARANFERLVGPLVAKLRSVPEPRKQGQQLLGVLHRGLLGEYDARATTLGDILERRRYNCVSASVLYNIMALRLGLDAGAQLLPTHARTLLTLPKSAASKQAVVVETTSQHGFDPSPAELERILAAVAGPREPSESGARAIVPDRGVNVDTLVLIGTIYINRASIVQEQDKFEQAERLFAVGEAFASGAAMRQVLRDQRAALLSQLGADDIISGSPERFLRAYRTLKSAIALEPKEPRIRSAVLQNLRAAAERVISQAADQKGEAAVEKLVLEAKKLGLSEAERAGLTAFALSEIARLHIKASRYEKALEAIERGLKMSLSPRDALLRATLEKNRLSALRLAAISWAKKGDLDKSMAFVERIERSTTLTKEAKKAAREDRLRLIHIVGNKLIDGRNFEEAAKVYREALRRYPRDETALHNLLAVLERLVLPMIKEGRCTQAEPHLKEIGKFDRKFASTGRVRCLSHAASAHLKAGEYAKAVELLKTATALMPKERSLRHNLAVALYRWAERGAEGGACRDARARVREIKALGKTKINRSQLAAVLRRCGG